MSTAKNTTLGNLSSEITVQGQSRAAKIQTLNGAFSEVVRLRSAVSSSSLAKIPVPTEHVVLGHYSFQLAEIGTIHNRE